MGRILDAVHSELTRDGHDGTATFSGWMDPNWAIGEVPHGGSSLSCVVTAAVKFMKLPEQEKKGKLHDPLHVSASYFLAAAVGEPFDVEIKLIKQGRQIGNLEACLLQKSHKDGKPTVRIHTMIIMTNFAALRANPTMKPTIPHGHALDPPLPIPRLSDCKLDPHMWSGDKIRSRSRMRFFDKKSFTEEARDKRRKIEAGYWLEFIDEETGELEEPKDGFKGANLGACFADWGESPVFILPEDLRMRVGTVWLPTLQLSIEFKREVDFERPLLRAGIHSSARFISQGVHELETDVWSHPADAKRLGLPEGQESTILAISRQVAMTYDMAINMKQNQKKGAKM